MLQLKEVIPSAKCPVVKALLNHNLPPLTSAPSTHPPVTPAVPTSPDAKTKLTSGHLDHLGPNYPPFPGTISRAC